MCDILNKNVVSIEFTAVVFLVSCVADLCDTDTQIRLDSLSCVGLNNSRDLVLMKEKVRRGFAVVDLQVYWFKLRLRLKASEQLNKVKTNGLPFSANQYRLYAHNSELISTKYSFKHHSSKGLY